ncbi:DUF2147 domain-containing protein [Salibacter halophilus]|uniref:DUF2147 domain-containing protein n=1 Tax=Salibacter halophilus TaxID=1803916 RepID=A0A6N6MAG3_9FLAO|nr:DUF2147 domain-containing protein [Salibacter halophilus]KAB1064065.1 DUF2147 domain-containing protein [Salibacter halophilus]
MKAILIAVAVLFSTSLFAQNADAVLGKWETKNGKSHVEIYKKDGEYYGKIVWLKEPLNEEGKPKVDKNNPEEDMRSRPLKGLELLREFEYDADDEMWEDGEIYDPESGDTYSCEMSLEGDNKLKVRGYLGISLLGRTTVWTRVE